MRSFLSAVRFLTTIPVPLRLKWQPPKMVPFFTLVGMGVGLLLAGFDVLLRGVPHPEIAAVLDVLFLVVITGALHVDGLADCADGLFSRKPKDEILAIMKDSRTGTMGVLAIVFLVLIKALAIYFLPPPLRFFALATAVAYGRGALVLGITFLKYARPTPGTGRDFFGGGSKTFNLISVLIPVVFSCYLGLTPFLIVLATFVILNAVLLIYFKRRLGGATGDTLGASCELTETAILLVMCLGSSGL
jgi:adenosylcobinamide-GDP ribazoletransferase